MKAALPWLLLATISACDEKSAPSVTPAPIVTRAPLARTWVSARSSRRTIVPIETSPSLSARMTSVPPARKRAERSDDSAAAAEALRIPLGEVRLLQSFPRAEGALVLVADGPGTSRNYHSQPVHTRA